MPANFTRRRDLFIDAGFVDPDAAISQIRDDADAIGLDQCDAGMIAEKLRDSAPMRAKLLGPELARLLADAPEWLFDRGGDLATLLWQAQRMGRPGQPCHLGALVFTVAERLFAGGRDREAASLLRFLVEVEFDWGDLYHQSGVMYEFFKPREPNPLVWELLKYIERRVYETGEHELDQVGILELGCGTGNDALGLLTNERVVAYRGIDISQKALDEHVKRMEPILTQRPELRHDLTPGDLVSVLRANQAGGPFNVVYSYSSLHYFNSGELREIFDLVRGILEPGIGLFAFGIKGHGSVWDGQGVPLYRPDVWINLDGQSRWFPSKSALSDMIVRHAYEIRLHQLHDHWSYSERGERDVFHYVVCSPRK